MTVSPPEISFVVCTHNPDPTILAETLASLLGQTGQVAFEILVINNASGPSPSQEIRAVLRNLDVKYIVEPTLGLSHARKAGIRETRAELICFVDDDNLLATNYALTALKIAKTEPMLGVFGGRSIARSERSPGWLCGHFIARYAIRDLPSPQTIEKPDRRLRGHEPFGAGMVVRKSVAEGFSRLVQALGAGLPLGRVGTSLGSGEDSLITRVAYRMGLQAGYRPELVLEHVVPANRLRWSYLKKLIAGQAFSEAVLDNLDGQWPEAAKINDRGSLLEAAVRFARRSISLGLAEAIGMSVWDTSYRIGRHRAAELADSITLVLDQIISPELPD